MALSTTILVMDNFLTGSLALSQSTGTARSIQSRPRLDEAVRLQALIIDATKVWTRAQGAAKMHGSAPIYSCGETLDVH
jgi:hypothetical protein